MLSFRSSSLRSLSGLLDGGLEPSLVEEASLKRSKVVVKTWRCSLLPACNILFQQFLFYAGTDAAARVKFQMMVTELIAVRYPTANEVAGPGGSDWGIDTYVGQLDDSVVVWQSKFFMDWKGEDQRGQVRASFTELLNKAKQKGFHVDAWTLCVPCVLSPVEQQWFDSWATKMKRVHKVSKINIWNGIELRRQLTQEDADTVRREFFPPVYGAEPSEPVAMAEDLHDLESALFVRQLEEAGYIETDAARGLFFAAEALARDLVARGNVTGVAALQELHLEIHNLWEQRFNASLPLADSNGRMAGFIEFVTKEAASCADPEGLRLRPTHRSGIVHRLVEDAKAGWVSHWRAIASSHDGVSATEVIAAQLSNAAQSGEIA
jgi:hypothetical protein